MKNPLVITYLLVNAISLILAGLKYSGLIGASWLLVAAPAIAVNVLALAIVVWAIFNFNVQ